jgi:hypothetical protein
MNIFLTALLISAAAFILFLAFSLVRASSDADDREEKWDDND